MTPIEAMKVLGLDHGFIPTDLKKQYRTKAKEHHPDIAGRESQEMFHTIRAAYELLTNIKAPISRGLTHKSIFDIVSE